MSEKSELSSTRYTHAIRKFSYARGFAGGWGWECPKCGYFVDSSFGQVMQQCFNCKLIIEAHGPGVGISEYKLSPLGRPLNDVIKTD